MSKTAIQIKHEHETQKIQLQSDLLNLAARAYRENKSLSFPQLHIKLRDQLYSTGTVDQLHYLDSLDAISFNRLASQAYDLQAGGFDLPTLADINNRLNGKV